MALNTSLSIDHENTTITSSQLCAAPLLPISLGPGTLTGVEAQSFCVPPCCVPCPPQGSIPYSTYGNSRHFFPTVRAFLQSTRLGQFGVVVVCCAVLYSLGGRVIPVSKVEIEESVCYRYRSRVGVLAYPGVYDSYCYAKKGVVYERDYSCERTESFVRCSR